MVSIASLHARWKELMAADETAFAASGPVSDGAIAASMLEQVELEEAIRLAVCETPADVLLKLEISMRLGCLARCNACRSWDLVESAMRDVRRLVG